MPTRSPPILTPSFVQAPPFGSASQPIPLPSPLRIYPLIPVPSETNSGHNLSESESDESENEGLHAGEPEIDERSDGEDERAAHQLLSAAPVDVPAGTSNPPVEMRPVTSNPSALSYGHEGFSVSSYLFLNATFDPLSQ